MCGGLTSSSFSSLFDLHLLTLALSFSVMIIHLAVNEYSIFALACTRNESEIASVLQEGSAQHSTQTCNTLWMQRTVYCAALLHSDRTTKRRQHGNKEHNT